MKEEDVGVYLIYETNGKASVLEGLNVTRQVASYRESLLRSEFKHSAAVTVLSTIMKRLVSSANSRIFEPISLTMSLMYN